MSTTKSTTNHSLRRKPRFRWIAAVLLTMILARPLQAFFGFGGVVFDASNLVENLRQMHAIINQMHQLAVQLRNQDWMLRQVDVNATSDLFAAIEQLRGTMHAPDMNSQSSGATRGQLHNRYPLPTRPLPVDHTTTLQESWQDQERADLIQWQRLSRQVQGDMSIAADRVAAVIHSSNGTFAPIHAKPGLTAVLQSRNQLEAIAAAEANKLAALRIMRQRIHAHQRAREQTERQLADQKREQLMRDWGKPAPSKPVRSAF